MHVFIHEWLGAALERAEVIWPAPTPGRRTAQLDFWCAGRKFPLRSKLRHTARWYQKAGILCLLQLGPPP